VFSRFRATAPAAFVTVRRGPGGGNQTDGRGLSVCGEARPLSRVPPRAVLAGATALAGPLTVTAGGPGRKKIPVAREQHLREGGTNGQRFLDMLGVFAEFETNLRKDPIDGAARSAHHRGRSPLRNSGDRPPCPRALRGLFFRHQPHGSRRQASCRVASVCCYIATPVNITDRATNLILT
jgi:hypothetical protein